MGAPLSAWPWNNLKIFKYVLYGPLLAQCFKYRVFGGSEAEKWCFYILLLCFLRGTVYQAGYMISTLMSFWKKYRIQREGVDFKQVDREWEWDNFILLQGVLATAACLLVPSLSSLPVFNYKGLICILLIHMGISEPLYYLMHRLFHTEFFFRNYHSLHHSSVVTTPQTAGTATFLEHLILSGIIGIPLTVASRLGVLSISMTYAYLLGFDFFRCLGHLNVEVVPLSLFKFMPFLRYLFYTPSYHSLHHTDMDSNYCLFMPLYDYLGKTLNKKSWHLHKKIRTEKETTVADFVFLAHSVDVHSSVHVPFVFRWLSAHPFRTTPLSLAFWPISFTIMLMIWAWGKTFTIRFYRLRDRLHETWCVPRYGFQYFLPFSLDGINSHIEDAILTADELGVKVISLAALNKNEALNGGGTLFVQKHPNLRVRVVHGNTLTAAVIINEIPKDVKEVFLTGATSKLGRAIALHLCKRGVRVLMLTLSNERFQAIQKEAPLDKQGYLVQVTKYQGAQHCKTWIVGKWISPGEQRWAPSGTHFHQFVVPPILKMRKDCTYGNLAAMRLPDDVQELSSCEYTMDRRIVHACHAGGVVHSLEGWDHHEVGAIEVDKIDVVWNAALKNGLTLV